MNTDGRRYFTPKVSPENLLPNLFFVYLVHEPRPDDDKENPRRYLAIRKGDAQDFLGQGKLIGAFPSKRKAKEFANIQRHLKKNWDKHRLQYGEVKREGTLLIYG